MKIEAKKLRERAGRIEEVGSDDTFSAVEELIKQFADIDPDSFSFRYPMQQDGEKSLKSISNQ